MRGYGRRAPEPLSEISRFLPWLAAHVVVGVILGAYFVADEYGEEIIGIYYKPVAVAALAAAVLAFVSWLLLGRRDPKRNIELGDFDRMMVYGRFGGGRNSKRLKDAVIELHLCNFNDALDELKEIEEEEEDEGRLSVVKFYMGRCYQLMGYPANGARYFGEAIDNGLKLNDTYLLEARCLTQNGRFDEAVDCYKVLLERDCYFDFIYTDIGIAYLKKGDSENALSYFKRAVDEGKNYPFALGGCSLAYLQMKNLEESGKYYKKALMCNMEDLNGFKVFYCNIAESVGLYDEIDPSIKRRRGFDGDDDDEIMR
ncbi:MAG: tetratricopeptide repeat protein [Ruminococcus sp.]|nr:tetratricopeptide repeat protein [Ruminococcus sp.]MCM1382264.1 tetratricopeptide repeat protein [Muribaculaceae bacterium]MCM1480503.1 tetratricopeptide repeat protein [Muribaculaceae bacterium]